MACSSGSTTYSYDAFRRLTSLTNNMSGTAYDITWTFSARNPANQITTWGASSTVYDYVETATSTESKSFDGLNRDATIAALSGGYDANGNLANEGTSGRVFKYDAYNRLLSVANGSTPTTPYLTLTYDTEGRLANYTYSATTTEFLYDGVNLISEYTHASGTTHGSDTLSKRYIHGAGVDEPLVTFSGSAVTSPSYLYANYQGSIIATTDSSGVLTDLYKYGPYGEPKNASNADSWTGSRFRYTGQTMIPEARLYYYKARVYDPNYGRFLQTDPIGSKDDLDLYAYVGGDPVNATDSTGMLEKRDVKNSYACEGYDEPNCHARQNDPDVLPPGSEGPVQQDCNEYPNDVPCPVEVLFKKPFCKWCQKAWIEIRDGGVYHSWEEEEDNRRRRRDPYIYNEYGRPIGLDVEYAKQVCSNYNAIINSNTEVGLAGGALGTIQGPTEVLGGGIGTITTILGLGGKAKECEVKSSE